MTSPVTPRLPRFYGWTVVAAAFVMAMFAWGLGFYGPSIYLKTVQDARGWSLGLTSAAVTLHFLFGAVAIVNLPRLHARFGLPKVTLAGAVLLALGVVGWASAQTPWQLLLATVFSGCGWVAMGVVAINALVSPWFVVQRPRALAMAYNGASIGGVIFSPLWVVLISAYGFQAAAIGLGGIMVAAVAVLARTVLAQSPQSKGLQADDGQTGATAGELPVAHPVASLSQAAARAPVRHLWRDPAFVTLAVGMALGLFAQIGLLTHLYSLLVPSLGKQWAGLALGLATAAAIVGRTAVGWLMRPNADRRQIAVVNYAVQLVGLGCLLMAGGHSVPWLLSGVVLFGLGLGNATSLPPLIAQVEFTPAQVPRVVALVAATAQASYAFAPWVFGLIRECVAAGWLEAGFALQGQAVFVVAALVQAAAAGMFWAGRGRYKQRD